MDDNLHKQIPDDPDFFKQVRPPFQKSREEMWKDMEARLDVHQPTHRWRFPSTSRWMIAAAVGVLMILTLAARFYTTTVECGFAEHLNHTLPDGSEVAMNAGSSLRYHPWWWSVDRMVEFSGEGFFEVEKGSNFSVQSPQGLTQVLGTSFNIYARQDRYEVFCLTGKVRVSLPGNADQGELTPNMRAWRDGDQLDISSDQSPSRDLAWRDGKFSFDGHLTLEEVFAEVARQYAVRIDHQVQGKDQVYQGFYPRPASAKDALDLICTTYGFTLNSVNEKHFTITE